MNKNLLLLVILLINISEIMAQENPWKGPSVNFSHGKLKVSENKRFLVFEDGTPFYYLGDTGAF